MKLFAIRPPQRNRALPIRSRIIGGIGAIVLLVAVISATTLWTQRTVGLTSLRIERSGRTVSSLRAIETAFFRLQKGVVEALLAASLGGYGSDAFARERSEIDAALTALRVAVTEFTGITGDSEAAHFRAASDTFEALVAELLSFDRGVTLSGIEVRFERVDEVFDAEYHELIGALLARHLAEVDRNSAHSALIASRAGAVALAVLVAALALSLLIALRLTASVLAPLRTLDGSATEIGRGSFDPAGHESLVQLAGTGDEFGVLARTFLTMAGDVASLNSSLQHLARHDDLTGLPNRAALLERLHTAIEMQRRLDQPFTLFFIDFDRFKEVNDRHGHHIGDLLLIEMAARLRGCVRSSDLVARLGGDEFTILIERHNDPEIFRRTADRILAAFEAPCEVAGLSIDTGTSIGVLPSGFPYGGPEEALRDADVAMYAAKARGGRCYCVHDASMTRATVGGGDPVRDTARQTGDRSAAAYSAPGAVRG